MPSVAMLERYALQAPEHDDTEQVLCKECGCPVEEDYHCNYCEEYPPNAH